MAGFLLYFGALLLLSMNAKASPEITEVRLILDQIQEPHSQLNKNGSLVSLGNASLDTANLIFLPEIHDDPESLLTQLLLIAREKQARKPFIILDESLPAKQKSMWDIFSQKSLEIMVAKKVRQAGEKYVPKEFENLLKNLVKKIQQLPAQLNFVEDTRLWTLSPFLEFAMPFFGWDLSNKASLAERNVHMTKTLRDALVNNDRVIIMAGARHIPELEFLTSQKLLCKGNHFEDESSYFSALDKKFGERPELPFGIGATLPIYKFLANQRYVIVFTEKLYSELDRVVNKMRNQNSSFCVQL